MSPAPLFWQRCLAAFREELTPQQFNTWIRPLAIEGVDGGYQLLAPNRFVLQWVKERFADRIGELAAAEGQAVPIALAVRDTPTAARQAPAATTNMTLPETTVERIAPAAAFVSPRMPARRNEQTSLNPGFTFTFADIKPHTFALEYTHNAPLFGAGITFEWLFSRWLSSSAAHFSRNFGRLIS